MRRSIPYFAFGTLQVGYPNYQRFAEVLGSSVGRARTADPYGIVLPLKPGCSNPGCRLLHRMVALVARPGTTRVDGDLFFVCEDGLDTLDRLEGVSTGGEGPYVRDEIEVVRLDNGERVTAQAFRARDPAAWEALVGAGSAEVLTRLPRAIAGGGELKPCCLRDPEHAGPHDVIDPLHGL